MIKEYKCTCVLNMAFDSPSEDTILQINEKISCPFVIHVYNLKRQQLFALLVAVITSYIACTCMMTLYSVTVF